MAEAKTESDGPRKPGKPRKRVSKKTKRSWRKHTNTEDVERFVEAECQRERLGSFSERPNSELFHVDAEPLACPKKLRREILRSGKKVPRCFDALENRSSVQDPIRVRNRVKTPEERRREKAARRCPANNTDGRPREKERRRRRRTTSRNDEEPSSAATPKEHRGEEECVKLDVWSSDVSPLASSKSLGGSCTAEWISAEATMHTLKTIGGITRRRIPASVRRKPSSGIEAVKAPHPGESYNPSYQDHQQLLRTIADRETELIKKEQHLERVTTKMFKKIPAEEKERILLEEMSQGLEKTAGDAGAEAVADDEEEEQETGEGEVAAVAVKKPSVKNRKKTLVQRRKQREQRQLMHQLRTAKLERKKVSDIYNLRKIQANLSSVEKKQAQIRERRALKKKLLRETGPKTLSKTKFEPAEPEFKLAEELTGALRSHEPAGSLLRDRFKSLQERGIVAPSQRKLKLERAKVKRFLKPEHKIDVDAYLASIAKTDARRNFSALAVT